MPHRGRLNVLTQVMGKPHRALFHEFKGGSSTPDEIEGSGDVKYHLGASSNREFDGNKVHLSLTANPSHLEIVDPVMLGKVRAKQDQHDATPEERRMIMPLLIHGDAAFAGQGVVAECFGLSDLKGYRTGGSIHFIVNNQIGFTTYPRYSRSSPYPSDVAKMIEAPILHVNGDDPEAVVYAAKVATEYRQQFQQPVVIDMFCYRRYGHNEGDEPSFTQPLMYKKIRAHPTTQEIYAKKLVAEGVVTEGEVEKMRADWRARLEAEFEGAQGYKPNKADWLDGRWSGLKAAVEVDDPRRGVTGVDEAVLRDIGKKITTVPEGFQAPPHHPALPRQPRQGDRDRRGHRLGDRRGAGLRLAAQGRPSGAAVRPGLASAAPSRSAIRCCSIRRPKSATPRSTSSAAARRATKCSTRCCRKKPCSASNTAIRPPSRTRSRCGKRSSATSPTAPRWCSTSSFRRASASGCACRASSACCRTATRARARSIPRRGSSAILQLCAEDNMQVANCTTPANYFHILRRQLNREIRKPLILMTPKSLLRHKRAVSRLDDMATGTTFHRLLWDDAQLLPDEKIKLVPDDKIRRVVLCSGKVYYDLYEEREKRGIDDVYLLRVEQLYPFPTKALVSELSRFKQAEIVWCQEEPRNMGAWFFVDVFLTWVLDQIGAKHRRARYAGRPGLGLDRGRPDVEASRAAQAVPRRGAGVAVSAPRQRGLSDGRVRVVTGASASRTMTRRRMAIRTNDHD